ncbi:MAG: DNA repair protein RecO [Hyphomicrobiales bacterium]
MQWSEDGVIVSVRAYGESNALAELFTRAHGRHLGLVRGGRSRRMRPVLQPGNTVRASWRARLSEHLGTFAIEPVKLRVAAIIDDPLRLAGLTTLTALVQLVAEREAHERLYDALLLVLDALETGDHWPALLVRWELGLLEELGFGLDLTQCAATGSQDDLIYVSPKSGRAVSAAAGEPYQDRLLNLPMFLRGIAGAEPSLDDILAGFALTGHFLNRHIFEPRGLQPPDARERVVARLKRSG